MNPKPKPTMQIQPCARCKGTRESPGSQLQPCADCGGHGLQVVLQ